VFPPWLSDTNRTSARKFSAWGILRTYRPDHWSCLQSLMKPKREFLYYILEISLKSRQVQEWLI